MFVIESGQQKILDAYVCYWTKGEGREVEVQYGREIEDDALLPPQVFVKRILRITCGVGIFWPLISSNLDWGSTSELNQKRPSQESESIGGTNCEHGFFSLGLGFANL